MKFRLLIRLTAQGAMLATLVMPFLGCQWNRAPKGNWPTTTVSGSKFMELYFRERNTVYHLDYRGVVAGYHYLDIFDVEFQSAALYRGSYRTPTEELPEDFPQSPQPPIESTYDDSRIINPKYRQ